MQNLREYIAWLIAAGHTSPELNEATRDALIREGWGFSQLRKIEVTDWVEMGVPKGLRGMIREKQKDWRAVATRVMIEDEVQRQQRAGMQSRERVVEVVEDLSSRD